MATRKKTQSDGHRGEQSAPAGLRGTRFRVEQNEMAVLSFPLSSIALPECLSPAERDVALGVIAGKSNAEIAACRGTSARTVANQMASLFKKLQVGSRREIAALGCRAQEADGKAKR
jgi:DNA-binding CsgD family transcriptional regulator